MKRTNSQPLRRFTTQKATLMYAPPETAMEVLRGRVIATHDFHEERINGLSPSGSAMKGLVQWCTEHTHFALWGEQDVQWGTMTLEERWEFVEYAFTPAELEAYMDAIIEGGSLPSHTLEALSRYLHIRMSKPCSCKVCKQHVRATRENQERHQCRYRDTPPHVMHILGWCYTGLDGVGLNDPYWLYQIKEVYGLAVNKARAESAKAQQDQSSAHQKLAAKGINVPRRH